MMKMRFKFIVLAFIGFAVLNESAFSQQSEVVGQSIELLRVLSSDSLFGRSISGKGKQKALAQVKAFIYKNISPDKLTEKTITAPSQINLIHQAEMAVNGESLRLMDDFLPHPGSPTATISGKIVLYDKNADLSNKIVLLSDSLIKAEHEIMQQVLRQNTRAIFISSTTDLLNSLATNVLPVPLIRIKQDKVQSADTISLTLKSELVPYPIENVVFSNQTEYDTSAVVTLMAHYDHLGVLADHLIFNGANDNASGVALASALFVSIVNEGFAIQLILTDAEESGLLGSKAVFESKRFIPIKYLINLDMVASGDGSYGLVGFKRDNPYSSEILEVFNGSKTKTIIRNNSANSDHYWFLESGVPGFFIYSNNGKQAYHSPKDDFISLELETYRKNFQIINEILGIIIKKQLMR